MADALPSTPVRHDGLTIAAVPPMTRYSLRARAPDGLPTILNAAAFAGGHALALGPDEWLLLLPEDASAPAIEGLHALTEIGDRNVGLIVEGPKAEALLQCGIALDLALPAFPVDKATRTLHEGVEIVLWRTQETRFHVEVWRSFSEHLFAALTMTAADV